MTFCFVFALLFFHLPKAFAASSGTISCYYVIKDTVAPSVNVSSVASPGTAQIAVYFGASDGESGLKDTNPYLVEISTVADLGSVVSDSGWTSQPQHIFSSLKRNGRFYFRAKARDKADNIGSSAIYSWRAKPGAFQSKSAQGKPARTGPNSFGFVGDASWEWDVPVKSGSALTITAYIRYNSGYGGAATKPKLTLSGKGISPTSVFATASAENAWELRTLNAGTPSQNATLTLRAEGFSTSPAAEFYIDDINVSQ
ncbi:MAG: hypothetical protein CVU77_08570 [Elusimicrobia bacterium HGW-Elusimicrobia-1]|jgi:hypothetical protein|nr:MAG: hypothetical protein CVU77_08570 [Elusimicrobia bacterium HGW-Elusimicrobia-1]